MRARSEWQIVRRLAERFRVASEAVELGVGDDAALLAAGNGPLGRASWVASVDASVQGVHFDLALLSLGDVGYRAFQAAVSDLAAMGATPTAALSALVLPPSLSDADLDELTAAQRDASSECQCPIVGGNISRGGELSITTTVLGRVEHALRRDAARPGEQVWLIGGLGLAAAGLAMLRAGPRALDDDAASTRCVLAWRRQRALLADGLALSGHASAAIDVSDGLASDARQLARASAVQIVIERPRLLAALEPALFGAARRLRRSALQLALRGGEDYALLATGPAAKRPAAAAVIGHVRQGRGAVLLSNGRYVPLRGGYDHLSRQR